MDRTCTDCGGVVKRGPLCKPCSMRAAWRRRRPDHTPPACKTCGAPITRRNGARGIYCSTKCKFADPDLRAKIGPRPNRVTKTCPGCGHDFAVPVSNAHRYTYCSRTCSTAARGVDGTCQRCGSAFRHSQTQRRRYCSETCRRPPITTTCGHCGDDFRVVPSAAARRRYCSMRCYFASGAETSIERRLREILERLRYVHRTQAQIGPWVVDFLVGDRLVIEADGTYWHTLRPDVDRRKTADITDRGYIVWRLSEDEINADAFPEVLERRLVDHEIAHGEIARLSPDEAAALADKHRVIPRQAKRPWARKRDPNQLVLDL